MTSTLLSRQRELLRAFRQTTAGRVQAEADAEARRKTDRDAADAFLTQATQFGEAQLAEARKASETGQSMLTQANLKHLWEQARVAPPDSHPVPASSVSVAAETPTTIAASEALQRWREATSVAVETPAKIAASIEALQRWREATTEALKKQREATALRRRRAISFTVIALVILAVAGVLGYQAWQKEQLYRPAVAALEAGQWDAARAELQQLLSIDSDYKDYQTLLRESYYRPGVGRDHLRDQNQLRDVENSYLPRESHRSAANAGWVRSRFIFQIHMTALSLWWVLS